MGQHTGRLRFKVGGNRVVVRVLHQNLGTLWKRYGCVVILRSRRKKRKNMDVRISNVYFGSSIPTSSGRSPDMRVIGSEEKQTRGKRRTRLTKYRIFLAGDGTTWSTGPDEWAKVEGVLCFIRVDNGSSSECRTVKAGKVPTDVSDVTAPSWFRK